MLLGVDGNESGEAEPGLRWYHGERFLVGWKGHLFLADGRGGEDVARWLVQELDRGGAAAFATCAPRIRGIHGLFVNDRGRGEWLVRSDDNGYYKIYYDDRHVGTSLLELWARRPEAPEPEALVEFFLHGFCLGGRTLAPHVRKLRGGEILRLAPGAPPRTSHGHRMVPETADVGALVEGYFDALATSLRDRRVSVDLTAGLDTRVIACLLHRRGLGFEAAVTGEPHSPDVICARHIAGLLGVPFSSWRQDLTRLEEELPLVFLAADGQQEIRGFHRDWQHARQRLARGVEVIVHGGGASIFKDLDFVQDFPFYGTSRIDFRRLYHLRWRPVRLPSTLLGVAGRALVADAEARALAAMEAECAAPSNNQAYNRVQIQVRGPEFYGRYFSNYINMGLDVAAPLGEWANLVAAMGIPPWQRFMARWHRRMLDRNCPALAALPTSDGYRGSLRLRYAPLNGLAFLGHATRRLARKTVQRTFGRNMFEKANIKTFNAPGYIGALRRTVWYERGRAELVRVGLFAKDSRPDEIPDFYVPRVITIGLLADWLERRQAPSRSREETVPGA